MKTSILFKLSSIVTMSGLCANLAFAQAVAIYGPGGPAPAIKAAAAAFEKQTGNTITVTAGPTPKWSEQAKKDADLIYSGSEHMMTDIATAMDGKVKESSITPLYIRPLAMLVRPGNPKHITQIKDLTNAGIKIMVVQGAGQTGAWEDMAGRKGELNTVRKIRSNIVSYAPNSAIAKETWQKDNTIDVWLIWNIWQVANPTLAQVVPIEKDYAIYRDTGVALTQKGESNPTAKQFVEYLQSAKGEAIFRKWGWSK